MQPLHYVVAGRGRTTVPVRPGHATFRKSLRRQIQRREDEFGGRLFGRVQRETKPTPSGDTFPRRALRVPEEVDAAKREAADARPLLPVTLIIGVLPTIAPELLPDVRTGFTEKFPRVDKRLDSSAATTWSWPGVGAACAAPGCRFDAADPPCWSEIHCWRPPDRREGRPVCRS